jgi:hypothetical protein
VRLVVVMLWVLFVGVQCCVVSRCCEVVHVMDRDSATVSHKDKDKREQYMDTVISMGVR